LNYCEIPSAPDLPVAVHTTEAFRLVIKQRRHEQGSVGVFDAEPGTE